MHVKIGKHEDLDKWKRSFFARQKNLQVRKDLDKFITKSEEQCLVPPMIEINYKCSVSPKTKLEEIDTLARKKIFPMKKVII